MDFAKNVRRILICRFGNRRKKKQIIHPICSVVAVFKMRMSILNTATTEQMGYGILSFFVYTKSTNQNLIPALLRAFSRMLTTVTDSVNSSYAAS